MPLQGTIEAAPDGALGFDTNTTLSFAKAQQFRNDDFRFCLRYLSLGNGQKPGDLTTAEADAILRAGLALMPVQHVRFPGWTPTAPLGTQTGKNAAHNAVQVGFPPGVNVWLDWEGADPQTSVANAIAYCNNWFDEVKAAGYVPGIYVGFNAILNSQQLYQKLKFQHYWKAGGNIPDIAVRGYQMIQKIPLDQSLHGIQIDRDTTRADNKGGQALWITR
ncbi:DUF1906 domain-containing protein [Pannus brasiliensis CCIBt3594]|uniref:DUF1906 domain-containing protein n=1 Tax=Pannus brasiliensis CCIBt3594 TaxID=1427578 RepID=A0AAW9QPM8_9CHRO